MRKHTATYVSVIAIAAVGTLAHGYVTGRWSHHGAKTEYVLPTVPLVLGAWQGEELKSSLADDKYLRNFTRRYAHTKTGRSFSVSLTLGPAGLTSQHTPEYCYPGSGYKAIGGTQPFAIDDSVFRTAVFRKDNVAGADGLRIFWAWSADGKWSAPKYPEIQFLGGLALYKLYIVSGDSDRIPDQDPELQDFLRQLLAELHKAIGEGTKS